MAAVACLTADQILRYLEGRLTAEERTLVDAHVDACEECHAVVATAGGGEAEARELETPLLNGDVIRQFVILGWLGRGGMGVVYDAYDRVLDRRVALKIMRPEAERRDTLLHEAKLAAKVGSPHAVVVYQADLEGDQVFV
ncbi:MAG: protein kinase, partial [Polyangiaceae bacterium]|nr:protein kinase [Polyangiaceae bacterium]